MRVKLIGMGLGTPETLTAQAVSCLQAADLLIGAQRLLDALDETLTSNRMAAIRPTDIVALLREGTATHPCVLYSGDVGFHSGAKSLLPFLREAGFDAELLPGISSVQYFAARLGEAWQTWSLQSAHGQNCDAVTAVMQAVPVCFLTGGEQTPATLCRQLADADLGELRVVVGENLSYPFERILHGTAADFQESIFAPLSVLLVEPAPRPYPQGCAGIPDEDFIRAEVPMTKQEVRAALLAKLAPRAGETLWDIGAGTGSVSVELARAATGVRVFAIECESKACSLITENRARFGAWNLQVVMGRAPAVLTHLPAPDAVFIGGSKGEIPAMIETVLDKNPAARICISAIALETLSVAVAALTAQGRTVSVTQIAVSRTQKLGDLHLLKAQNPIFLIVGERHV